MCASHTSSLGILSLIIGATFVLDIARDTQISPSEVIIWAYTTAAYNYMQTCKIHATPPVSQGSPSGNSNEE